MANVNPIERFSLQGKSIIITGASGSMGREAAMGLGAAGANITLAGGNRAALEELAALPELAGAAIAAYRPETPEDAKAIVDVAVAAFGRLDGMLVAVGAAERGWQGSEERPEAMRTEAANRDKGTDNRDKGTDNRDKGTD